MHRGSHRIWNPVRNLGFLTTLLILSVLFSTPVSAFGDCYNFGVYNVNVVEKKKNGTFDGDLKELNVKYDYDNNIFRIKLTYNKVPNSNQTTGINIGFYDGFECTSTDEYYKTKGFSKKITRDYENITGQLDDLDWVGNLKLVTSTSKSLTLDWIGPKAYKNDRLTEYCVRAVVTQLGTFYQNGINCITTGPFTNCTGPGYVSGIITKDELTNWVKTKYDDLDTIDCGGPKSNFSIPSPSPSINATPSSISSPTSTAVAVVANMIKDFSGVRNTTGIVFKFTAPSNINTSNFINYELGIQYLKIPTADYKLDSNYSEIKMLQFARDPSFNVSYIEIKDWLKALNLETNTRAVMFKVRTNTSGGISSQWSNGLYVLPTEYN